MTRLVFRKIAAYPLRTLIRIFTGTQACILLAFMAIFLLLLSGCATTGETFKTTTDDWLKLQLSIAKALNEHWGGESFHIVPTKGAAYPIGTAFNIGSPSPLTESCQINKDSIRYEDVPPMPKFTSGTKFNVDVTVPKKWLDAIKIGTAKVGAMMSNSMEFSITEMEQSFVYEDKFKETLVDENCLNKLGNVLERDKLMVRGYISCKYSVSSTKKWGANAKLKVIENDGLDITFDRDSGSYRIDQQKPFKWFTIFTKVSAKKVLASAGEGSEIRTLEELKEKIRNDPSSFVMSDTGMLSKDLEKIGALDFERSKSSVVSIELEKPQEAELKALADKTIQ